MAHSAARGAPVALATLARSVEPAARVTVRWEDGEATATVEDLPLVGDEPDA